MRLSLPALMLLLLLVPGSMLGQEIPKGEIFGGYSYFTADDSGNFLDDYTGLNLHGWNASVSGNVNSWFGVVGDFSGHYGSPSFGPFGIPGVNTNVHSFLVGPKLAYRGSDTLTPFAHFLIGVTRAEAGVFGLGYSRNALAAGIGGGLDVRLTDAFAIRAVQADYLMTRFFDDRQNNFRVSAGIVFRF